MRHFSLERHHQDGVHDDDGTCDGDDDYYYFFFSPNPRVRVRRPIVETPRRQDARPSRGPEGCRVTSSPRSRHACVRRPRARDGRDATPMTTRNGGCNIV